MELSVIISTYNQPQWLEWVLLGYSHQRYRDFELIIADDGSTQETATLIRSHQKAGNLAIRHVWHPDDGFRKCVILNEAIRAASADYLVFSDGDCIPAPDFLEQHVRRRRAGTFLSGGYIKLNATCTERVDASGIATGQVFTRSFFRSGGMSCNPFAKHCVSGGLAAVWNALTPTKATWNGHNASCWKTDALRVNGFDERMVYGGEDREFGERLVNAGIRSCQIRYHAHCVHLDHARGYVTEQGIRFNKSIRAETRRSGRFWTDHGMVKAASD